MQNQLPTDTYTLHTPHTPTSATACAPNRTRKRSSARCQYILRTKIPYTLAQRLRLQYIFISHIFSHCLLGIDEPRTATRSHHQGYEMQCIRKMGAAAVQPSNRHTRVRDRSRDARAADAVCGYRPIIACIRSTHCWLWWSGQSRRTGGQYKNAASFARRSARPCPSNVILFRSCTNVLCWARGLDVHTPSSSSSSCRRHVAASSTAANGLGMSMHRGIRTARQPHVPFYNCNRMFSGENFPGAIKYLLLLSHIRACSLNRPATAGGGKSFDHALNKLGARTAASTAVAAVIIIAISSAIMFNAETAFELINPLAKTPSVRTVCVNVVVVGYLIESSTRCFFVCLHAAPARSRCT